MSEIIVLYEGYSILKKSDEMTAESINHETGKDQMTANCSCTLIKGAHNVIVDTMTAWDSEKIIAALQKQKIALEQINYVVSTHGHSDHIGNNNLFLKAKHIVGFSISFKDCYYIHGFDKGEEYLINNSTKIIPTPGHTLSDVSVIVQTPLAETVAITGDLFERFEDIENPNIWLEAGSENPVLQMKNRSRVADIADWIVPGHGPKFEVTHEIRSSLKTQAGSQKTNLE